MNRPVFWLFSNCHCKNTHADMSIPKIPACKRISLASNYTFRISELKLLSIKLIKVFILLLEQTTYEI